MQRQLYSIRWAAITGGLALSLFGSALAAGQTTAKDTTKASSTSSKLFTRRDAWIAIGTVATTVAITHFDPRIEHFFQDTNFAHVRLGRRLDATFTRINETTLTAAGILSYGIGRLTGSPLITDVAFHTTEAVVTASLSAQLIRGPLGRSRPQETNYTNQYDFHWFQGFTNFKYRAFPSIHSGSGFAAATVIVAETNRRDLDADWYVAPVAYALAMTPGLARMYLGEHWASDIFAGAVLGTFTGLKVVNYSHDHPGNRMDRIFVPAVKHLQVSYDNSHDFLLGWTTAY